MIILKIEKIPNIPLYEIKKDVKCIECGNTCAIRYYGKYYPVGLKSNAGQFLEKYKNSPYMSRAVGFGGTIPWECTKCGNKGLIDIGGLECYKKAFESIKKDEEV